MEATVQRIGLIAGAGEVPVYFARKAKSQGLHVFSVGLSDAIAQSLEPHVEKGFSINIGQPGKMKKVLEAEGIQGLVIMGKVEKSMVFKLQMLDLQALKMVKSFKTHQDKSIMLSIIHEIEKEGGTVLDQKKLLPELFPEKGVLTRKKPSDKVLQDIEFGLPVARRMADDEIGQTIVVKNQTVIAVEAVEGTDKTVSRGCELANGGCTVVKVSRTQQDYRFDAPGVGPHTVELMIAGKASALAVEADRVMVIERERTVDMANRAGLSIVAV